MLLCKEKGAARTVLEDYSICVIFFDLREQTNSLGSPADCADLRRIHSIIHFTFSIFNHKGHKEKGAKSTEQCVVNLEVE
jgi:hypothetical protein